MRVTPFFIGKGISEKGNMFYMVMMTCGLRCVEKNACCFRNNIGHLFEVQSEHVMRV